MTKSPDAFRTISEVAEWLGVQAHVLRFWESKFTQVKPVKRAGGRRYYRPADMMLLGGIKTLLHEDGLTIKGVQKILREQGIAEVSSLSPSLGGTPLSDTGDTLDTPASDVSGTVVRFRTAPPSPDPEPEDRRDEPASGAAPPQSTEPDQPDATDGSDPDPVHPADPPTDTEPEDEDEAWPTFVHRPAPPPAPAAGESSAAGPDTPEPPGPPSVRIVDAPDPPADHAMPYHPGALAHLARVDRLTPDQVAGLAPLATQLRAILARSQGAGSA